MNEPAAIDAADPSRRRRRRLRDAPLRAILQACYDLQAEGQSPSYENLMIRLEDPAVRGLATDLIVSDGPVHARSGALARGRASGSLARAPGKHADRAGRTRTAGRLKDLKRALDETDPHADPDAYRAIELEYRRLLTSGRPRKT